MPISASFDEIVRKFFDRPGMFSRSVSIVASLPSYLILKRAQWGRKFLIRASPASTSDIISLVISVPAGTLEARHAAEGFNAVGSAKDEEIFLISLLEIPN